MNRLLVKGSYYNVANVEEFLWLIDEQMGEDARDWAKEYLKPEEKSCGGECDETYRLQEHFERVIRDAVEDLEPIKGKTAKMDEQLQRVIRSLNAEI